TVRGNISTKNRDPTACAERGRAEPNDFVLRDFIVVQVANPLTEKTALLDFLEVFPQRFAGDGEAIEMKEISQFEHQPRNSTDVPEVFDGITSGCLDVGQYRNDTIDTIEVVNRDVDTCFVGNGRKVNQCVGGSTGDGVNNNRILE